ncbi:MAG: flavin-containing monooxygenase, partial [Gaiellaceae bacterium]
LPGYRIPRRYGRWVSRDGVLSYLREYVEVNRLEVRVGTRVERVDRENGGWVLQTSSGPVRSARVVVATGFSHTPFVPDWPGRHGFRGQLLHSSAYRNSEPFRGRDVLVVGSGNSGAEIAFDVAEGGASRVWLAVRTPPQIARRASFGIPTQAVGITLGHLPPRLAGRVAQTLRRLTVPDLSAYGLARPRETLGVQFARTRTIPILDVGLVAAVQAGRVEVVGAVESLDGDDVLLTSGPRMRPDVVIAATGFRPGLEPLVGHLVPLGERGLPQADEPVAGLHFVGYHLTLGGMLRKIGRDARTLARRVAAEGQAVAGLPTRTPII